MDTGALSGAPTQRTTEQGLQAGEGITLDLRSGDDASATAALVAYTKPEVAFSEKERCGKFQVTDRDHTGILLYIENAPVKAVTFDCAFLFEHTKESSTKRAIT